MDEEAYIRLLEAAAWLIGGFGTILTLLLSAIAFLIKRSSDKIEVRIDKHDEKFDKVQEEIFSLAKTTGEAIAVIKATMPKQKKG